jgi:hypothetical protein
MPRGWSGNHWSYVVGEYKGWIVWPVENEYKLMLRMVTGDALQSLIGKPPDPFELILEQ